MTGIRYAAPPGGDLAALFHHASRLLARMAHRHDGGSHAQERVLSVIRDHGPLPQRELLERFGVRSASLSEVLAKLERAGRITRFRDEEDRRGFIVSAVKDASDPAAEDCDAHQVLNENVFAVLTVEEREQLAKLLDKLVTALEQDVPSGQGGPGCSRGPRGRGRGRGGRHGRE